MRLYSTQILMLMMTFTIALSLPVIAKEKYDRVYKYQSSDGVVSFSDIEPINTPYEITKVGCFACGLTSQIDWYTTKLYQSNYQTEIMTFAHEFDVDPALIRAIIHAESHFQRNAVSKQGALGLMQLMPETAKELGVTKPFEVKQNIEGGVKHLARLMKKYKGDIELVSAAYNAGETNIDKYQGVPPFPETQVYIERVQILHKRYQQSS